MQEFDIIIVGAGLVGLSLACALQHHGIKIAILEKNLPADRAGQALNNRPISLAYASVQIFKTLGVWPALEPSARQISEVHVSEQGVLGALHFTADEQRVDALGQVVPYEALYTALYKHVVKDKSVEIIASEAIRDIQREQGVVTVTCVVAGQPRQCRAQLLVGCDGASSFVRSFFNIKTNMQPAGKQALTATLTLAKAYPPVAHERFTPEGVLALLPLSELHQCGLVYTFTQEKADTVKAWDEQALIHFIERCFPPNLLKISAATTNALFSLSSLTAERQSLAQVLLLGNAAHTLYPLAAQGFNLGLRDVAACAEVLVEAKRALKNLGSEAVLQRYLDWRAADQARVLRLTHHVATGFSVNLPSLPTLRGVSLLMTDLISPLKNRVAKLTLGLSGKVPKLARGLVL